MQSSGTVQFRPAQAGDAADLAPLVHASGPAAFDYVFARPAASSRAILGRMLARPYGEFGYAIHVCGAVDGAVVAAGAAWAAGDRECTHLRTAWSMLRTLGPRAMAGAARRGVDTEAVMPGPAKDEWYIGHLGVSAAMRGRGIGAALVAHLLALGQRAGATTAVLDVSAENPRAEALYARLGFTTVRETASNLVNDHGRVPGHKRMHRILQP